MIPNPGGLIVKESVLVTAGEALVDALSVSRTAKVLDPAAPGVPDIVPPADRLKPAGSVPLDTDHEYGGAPPDAPSACE